MAQTGILSILLLFFTPSDQVPVDALSVVRADVGLEILGHSTDDETLEKLIETPAGGPAVVEAVRVDEEVRKAIQNLASRTQEIRATARRELTAKGPGILPRLRELVEKDPRRAEEAKKVIAAIEGQQEAAGHVKELARQFAIRLAARKKLTKLVPAIRGALESENPFVRLAAEDALARLDKTYKEPTTVKIPGGGFRELEALPPETRMVLALRLPVPEPGVEEPITIHGYVDMLRKSLPGGFPVDDAEFESQIQEGCQAVVDWVRSYGNMRPDRVYLANVGGVGENGGGLGIFVRGLYEPAVLRQMLSTSPIWTTSEVSDYTVHNSAFLRLVLLDDHSVLILPVVASNHFPLSDYLASLRKGEKTLREEKRFARFLDTLGDGTPVRGYAITDEKLMGDIYQEIRSGSPQYLSDAIEAMTDLALTIADAGEDKMRLRLEASFSSEEGAKDLAGFLRTQIDNGIREMEQMAQQFPMPGIQAALDIAKAIVVSAEGRRGILRFTANKLKIEDIFGGMMGTTIR